MTNATLTMTNHVKSAEFIANMLDTLLSSFPGWNVRFEHDLYHAYYTYGIGNEDRGHSVRRSCGHFPMEAESIYNTFAEMFNYLGFELSYNINLTAMSVIWTLTQKEISDNFWGDL